MNLLDLGITESKFLGFICRIIIINSACKISDYLARKETGKLTLILGALAGKKKK